MHGCSDAYKTISLDNLASIRYIPLEFDTIHICVYTDGHFRTFTISILKLVSFSFSLMVKMLHYIPLNSSRATRRPSSTEEAELFALEVALQRFRNERQIMFQLLQKEVPEVQ